MGPLSWGTGMSSTHSTSGADVSTAQCAVTLSSTLRTVSD